MTMTGTGTTAAFRFGAWRVEPELNRLSKGDQTRSLEARAMDVLVYLLERPDRVVSADELLEALWPDRVVEQSTIHRQINQLRRALGDDSRHPEYIRTVVKRGYQAIAPVAVVRASLPPTATANGAAVARGPMWPVAILVGAALAVGLLATWWLRSSAEGDDRPQETAVIGVHLPVDLTGAANGVAAQRAVAQALVAALRAGMPHRIVPLYGAGGATDRTDLDYRLRGAIGADGLSVELLTAPGGDLVWAEEVPLTEDPVLGRKLGKGPYVANVVRDTIVRQRGPRQGLDWPFSDARARSLFLKGLERFAREDFDGAIPDRRATARLFEQAAALEPESPAPAMMLAFTYGQSRWIDDVRERSRLANYWAERAVALGSDLPGAHLAAGYVELFVDRDFEAARRYYERAAALGAGGQVIEHQLGNLSFLQGDLDAAAGHYRAALAAGGRTQDRGQLLQNLAITLGLLGQHEQALATLDELRQSVRVDPEDLPWLRIRALAHLGRRDAARRELDRLLDAEPPPPGHRTVAALALLGSPEEARALLAALDAQHTAGQRLPAMDAFRASVHLGDLDGAFLWLNRAIDRREPAANAGTLQGRAFEGLRDDPRLAAALARIEDYRID